MKRKKFPKHGIHIQWMTERPDRLSCGITLSSEDPATAIGLSRFYAVKEACEDGDVSFSGFAPVGAREEDMPSSLYIIISPSTPKGKRVLLAMAKRPMPTLDEVKKPHAPYR